MIDLLGTADVTYIIIKLARTALSAYEYYIITTKNILQNGKKMLIFFAVCWIFMYKLFHFLTNIEKLTYFWSISTTFSKNQGGYKTETPLSLQQFCLQIQLDSDKLLGPFKIISWKFHAFQKIQHIFFAISRIFMKFHVFVNTWKCVFEP